MEKENSAKTIEDLNKKVWYRLLKVFWVGFWFLIALFALIMQVTDYGSNRGGALSRCYNNLSEGGTLDREAIFRAADYVKRTDINRLHKLFGILVEYGAPVNNYYTSSSYNQFESSGAEEFKFEYSPKYTKDQLCEDAMNYSSGSRLIYYIIPYLVILSLFEAGRRIFYYIVLGSFDPK